MTDRTPRYRRLKSTGANIFWHVCAECGSTNAPYGFGVVRISGAGKWVDERDYRNHKTGKKLWQGNPPTTNCGTWFCAMHKHLGEILEHGVNTGCSLELAPS